jgi:hypothetical protein
MIVAIAVAIAVGVAKCAKNERGEIKKPPKAACVLSLIDRDDCGPSCGFVLDQRAVRKDFLSYIWWS